MSEKHKCECPSSAPEGEGMPDNWYSKKELLYRYHKKNECKNPETKLYSRKGKPIWLCSCCNMLIDDEVTR